MSNGTAPASWNVRVRMYCHGLGDCFLISFSGGGHVLIDCGVLNPKYSKLRDAVADVAAVTGGKIDVVVITHEHWDHVSGFTQARDLFDKIAFDDVWMGWTEKPGDSEADQLHQRYDKIKDTLRLVSSYPGNPVADQTRELLGFFGLNSAALAFSDSTREALDYVRARMKGTGKGRYCEPGETIVPFANGVKFHVLGPPRGKLLKKKDPAPGSRETYELALASATIDDPDSRNTWDFPFEACFKRESDPAAPGTKLPQVLGVYNDPGEAWRRVDNDWLAGSAELALQMDSYTNNTSLALAVELPSGDVLLFPGDAQVGNWQSWHEVQWKTPDVSAAGLLARTVLYKAGHHASHNGTLRDKGLELMTSLREVMIPTDEAYALTRNPKGSWQMPAKPLYAALDQKSNHNVVRSDGAGDTLYVDWYV